MEFSVMVVSIPLALLLLIAVILLVRGGFVRIGPATACALFGFFTASTGIAPLLTDAADAITRMISAL
ncbi:hypothetical protein [Streptomyces sp. NPDC093990]|uniref:hypothetical protein n=1 Tax=Streptomyces sp. NPDC093990 TaxID=3155306 RepID=UPI0034470614